MVFQKRRRYVVCGLKNPNEICLLYKVVIEMLNVMFENSKGHSRIIGTVENEESAFKVINDFLDDHKYKSYYQRTWKKDDKTTVVDVGSHTEFFYIQEV